MTTITHDPIAIVGMACRFPGGAHSPQAFWQLLIAGQDAIIDVPPDRWNADRFYHPDPDRPGKMYVRQGGFLQQALGAFDAGFFNITPREAEQLDPQQRLLLEVTLEAFEDSGATPGEFSGAKVGVYIGAFTMDNMAHQLSDFNRHHIMSHTGMGNTMVMLSNRLSYMFNLRGPSMTVDTACSSSLVSLHLACQALHNDECEVALSGGVNIMSRPEFVLAMSKGRFLSPSMRSKTFDATADGYVRGEGAGILVLKRLSRAHADGDRIHAIIAATGVNQDGRTEGITLPNRDAQVSLMQEVWQKAGVSADDIDYFEAHGTGTQAGDVTEANSIGTMLAERQTACPVGSVKANIGHLEAAAGVAGVIKAVLVLQQRTSPPHLHLNEVNPKIDLEALNIAIPLQSQPWSTSNHPARVAVNSFGYGGTNAHAIIQQAPPLLQAVAEVTAAPPVPLYTYSARSENSLRMLAAAHVDLIEPELPATDYAYTLAHLREHYDHRLAVIAEDVDTLKAALDAFAAGRASDNTVYNVATHNQTPGLVFVYTGMGAQSLGMGRDLLHNNPVFANTLTTIDALFQQQAGWSLLPLFEKSTGNPITAPDSAQPANFALQIALTDVWRSLGIYPGAVVGHSVGEVAAAVVAGSLSLEEGVRLIYHRSRLQQGLSHQGGMLAVALSEEAVQPYLTPRVSLAAINSASSVTLAGMPDALSDIAAQLEAEGVFNRMLYVDVAYHSYQMEPLEVELLAALNGLAPSPPQIPLYSTVYGQQLPPGDMQDSAYWWRNCRSPVLLQHAIQSLLVDGFTGFVEIGPHPVLAAAVQECLLVEDVAGVVVPSLRRGTNSLDQLYRSLALLYTHGFMPDFATLYPSGKQVTLPGYAWDHIELWTEAADATQDRVGAIQHPLVQLRKFTAEHDWYSDLDILALDFLRDHRVEDQPVMPASGYIEAALATMLLGDAYAGSNTVADLEFVRMLNLDHTTIFEIYDAGDGYLSMHSRPATDPTNWMHHANGRILKAPLPPRTTVLDLHGIRQRCTEFAEAHELYTLLAGRGMHYGPSFQWLQKVYRGDDEFLTCIPQPAQGTDFFVHPVVLDAGFQAFILMHADADNAGQIFLPVGVADVRYHQPLQGEVWCHGRVVRGDKHELEGQLIFCDTTGHPLLELFGVRLQAMPGNTTPPPALEDLLYTLEYEEIDAPTADGALEGLWLICGDDAQLAGGLTLGDVPHEVVPLHDKTTPANGKAIDRDFLSPLADTLRGVVYLWGAEAVLSANPIDQSQLAMQEGARLLQFVQALLRLQPPHLTTIAIVTNGSQPVPDASAAQHPAQMVLWGIGRVLANEHTDVCVNLIDLDPDVPHTTIAQVVPLLHHCDEPEIVLRGGKVYANRFNHFKQPDPTPAWLPPETSAQLRLGQPGVLDSLHYEATKRTTPAPDEVEVRVRASALNFKDVMKALNLLPARYLSKTFFGDALGLEFAGEVVQVGEQVTDYAPGDAVVGMSAAGGFRTYTITHPHTLTHMPKKLGFAESVVFTNFVTAYFCLHDVARVQRGDRVLIHSASGGVGLAAIQIARWLGAEVIATAGTSEKRAFLQHEIGITNVSDSRSLRFVEDVRRWTDGRGVDVVLNTLAGEALQQGLKLLAPFGRFIEIGKKDITENARLNLAAFDQNLVFASVDIDLMAQNQPQKLLHLLNTVRDLFDAGTFKPLPLTTFPASQASEAFRLMAKSQHIGKIVVTLNEDTMPIYPDPQRLLVQPDRAYLVTGGFGGFGLETARWLVGQGARHLALVSRSGPKDERAQTALKDFAAAGVRVLNLQADVAQPADVRQMLAKIRQHLPPLAGIVHSAMVLDDALLTELTPDRLSHVLAPKVIGAWQLHQQTRSAALDFFLMFSSISAVIGNPRQANYVAANAFLDGLAHYRRAQGLPALSVNLGPLGEAGVVARNPKVAQYLQSIGLTSLSVDIVMQALALALRQGIPQVSVVDIDWQKWMNSSMFGAESPRYHKLTNQLRVQGVGESSLLGRLNNVPVDEQVNLVVTFLIEQLAKVTRLDVERFDPDLSFDRLGLDSLMVLELNNLIRLETGHEFSVVSLSQAPTIRQMAQQLITTLYETQPDEA